MLNSRGQRQMSYAGVTANGRGSSRRGGRKPPVAGPQAMFAQARRVFNYTPLRVPRVPPPPPPIVTNGQSVAYPRQQQRQNLQNFCPCGRMGIIWCVDCTRMFCKDPCPAYYMSCKKHGSNQASTSQAGVQQAARPPPAHQNQAEGLGRLGDGHHFVRGAEAVDLGMQRLSLNDDNGYQWDEGAGERPASRSSDSDSSGGSGSSMTTVIAAPGYGGAGVDVAGAFDDNNNGARDTVTHFGYSFAHAVKLN